jgi:hypothetical protein
MHTTETWMMEDSVLVDCAGSTRGKIPAVKGGRSGVFNS